MRWHHSHGKRATAVLVAGGGGGGGGSAPGWETGPGAQFCCNKDADGGAGTVFDGRIGGPTWADWPCVGAGCATELGENEPVAAEL